MPTFLLLQVNENSAAYQAGRNLAFIVVAVVAIVVVVCFYETEPRSKRSLLD